MLKLYMKQVEIYLAKANNKGGDKTAWMCRMAYTLNAMLAYNSPVFLMSIYIWAVGPENLVFVNATN